MRSIWKGNYLRKKKNIIYNNSLILNSLLRNQFLVHNGKSFNSVTIKREMIGLKVGEFVFTRKIGVLHKKKVKNKGKKK